ncbi:maleylpyruvate isomerase family mycothiol-dependent enzyme [Mycobacterium sp. ACS4331]|uniref:maleylpyruvate isomerase family mycothiol-dependent enzyme n=1 Tax=Mycobacterium sp. ACS4331 TaxID=1834121 RepID=UPI0008015932|nr:maleylpyruvate isomerase family mycothiol-dependent enzyme [Mycobacterium sp. ACS4331]OBF23328.1 hypothetical protein A5727_06965 [Mycobacterium sp. ACS4331]
MRSARALARAQREEFADLLDSLTPEQWAMPSLCAGWTVRDVAAHTIAYLAQSRVRLALNMVRASGDVDRLNACALSDFASSPPEELARMMRAGAEPSGAAALYRCRVALIECLIHQQDIRRPLGLPRVVSEEAVRVCLDYARISPVIGGARRTRGLRLAATDSDWSAGRGPEVCATGEVLLLAMTGRAPAVAGELSGDGAELLVRRGDDRV